MAPDEPLLVLEPRVGRFVARSAIEAVGIGTTTAVLVWLLYYLTRDSDSFTAAMVFLGGVCTISFFGGAALLRRIANGLLCVASARKAVEVALDEGGLRFAGGDGLTYWPLEQLDEPVVIGRWLGRVELVLRHVDEERSERIVLFHPDAIAEAQRLERETAKRIDALRRDLPPGAAELQRRGDALQPWLDRIDEVVSPRGGGATFRSATLDRESLKALVRDVRFTADVRGAAAYGLATVAPKDAPALLRDVLTDATPPLVVALVALAPLDETVVSKQAIAAAMAYVDEELGSAVLRAALSR
ncbi:MAG: hypothetical protein JRI23_10495 [Deltaproteobacteria bacterium]|nr:hypothetical protein [Deltaproteobacteria bacterium]MBW2532104.1 hypothetical protein [Deltaproteobacteria bacterium]